MLGVASKEIGHELKVDQIGQSTKVDNLIRAGYQLRLKDLTTNGTSCSRT